VDKVKKIAERLWYFKERFVLVVLLIVLGGNVYNLYRTAYPKEASKDTTYLLPKASLGEDWTPAPPPPPPVTRQPTKWPEIFTPNPFWYLANQANTSVKKQGAEDAGISLIRITTVQGKNRAQLQTASSKKWYYEGESFESFELLKIDPGEGTCQVRSERLGKVIALRLPEK